MYELENVLRPYAWGSPTAIAELLGRPASGGPEAELWIGAHPDSPSVALTPAAGTGRHTPETRDDGRLALDALIAEDPEHCLGGESVAAFGPRLPFLLKVLAAEYALVPAGAPDAQPGPGGLRTRGSRRRRPRRHGTQLQG